MYNGVGGGSGEKRDAESIEQKAMRERSEKAEEKTGEDVPRLGRGLQVGGCGLEEDLSCNLGQR